MDDSAGGAVAGHGGRCPCLLKQALLLKADLPSKIIVNAFGLAAEIEADLISQRTKAGIAAAKAKGVKLGNPNQKRDNAIRSRNADEFALALEKTIRGYQALGMTQRGIVRELNETKIKTRRGGHWYQATLQNLRKRLGKGWREERMKR